MTRPAGSWLYASIPQSHSLCNTIQTTGPCLLAIPFWINHCPVISLNLFWLFTVWVRYYKSCCGFKFQELYHWVTHTCVHLQNEEWLPFLFAPSYSWHHYIQATMRDWIFFLPELHCVAALYPGQHLLNYVDIPDHLNPFSGFKGSINTR